MSLECLVTVSNPLGLHARPSARLVTVASQFKSRILIRRMDDLSFVDASSILSVMFLAASHGTRLVIRAEGEDERAALAAVVALFTETQESSHVF
ncbi:MAG: HPr family phosphocarrier protein [Chloracidobacterium sp.]|uniref:HPr family phosphocarrier protein n=1 Tax=Chloracidobacterium validum TaxID=2821543 RepID=A0ABX8BD80_9BACT|nr:HPr family phosphocarrier protein [Chloracidobacterium validum]QUW03045.1 HPr family phosphocarrier protein [Chloracidobacterium validum]